MKASLKASGLTSDLCSQAISKSMGKLPFVASVTAYIKSPSFQLVFRNAADINIDARIYHVTI